MILDAIIVGQGLAGTALAWELLRRDAHILVVDREAGDGASRVAAGLVTPVTGRALSSPPDFLRDRAVAAAHYRTVEQQTRSKIWHERGALRLFKTSADVARWSKRESALGALLATAQRPPDAGFAPMAHAALMPDAARLDVAHYLDVSRTAFVERGCYERGNVDTQALRIDDDGVAVAGVARRARFVVLCGGSKDANSAWLPARALSPAKGEIITAQVDDFHETRTTHCGGHWLLPTQRPGTYQFGATYDHDDATANTTPAARELLGRHLGQIVQRRFEIVGQQAGLRPVGARRRPIVGAHPVHRRVVVFNGLGSRGVLWAPGIARDLASRLHGGIDDVGPLSLDMHG